MNKRIVHCIELFEKNGENFIASMNLSEAPLEFLQKLVGAPSDDPIFHLFPLDSDQLKKLAPYIDGTINLDACKCYLTAASES